MESVEKKSLNFIEQIIEKELSVNPQNKIITRFPPEPNGYLHIGHAKSICLNFGLANKYGGKCNLRFDDTNPAKEDTEYVNSIMDDIKWLGFEWNGKPRYASDYFEQLYSWGELLIRKNKAYVCDMSADEVAQSRGTPTVPGKESPYRNRSIEENLELFSKMKNGGFPDGTKTLRAKTDMSTPNMQMRDPVLYRILRSHHHRTGDKWCIYPMYDFAHGQSDFIEGITHSICTLEFEIHRPLYDWFLDQICEEGQIRPRQIEFARLNLTYTVMSKRILLDLVKSKTVSGWDDPRMPT
ncbi:MAG TPA: glutamine--tRNA ligase, partial [Spirochaetota bacterium]|nr:glutamine--tRNA ligase [Spirochaetota bacterium]